MARAMISLPVPVSPNSSTGALLRDTIARARHHRGQPGVAANQPFLAGARVAVIRCSAAAGPPAVALDFL